MYKINRDGFTLLAMGFTGKDALEWKLKYMNAFNDMENKLNSPEYIINRALEMSRKQVEDLMIENTQQQALIGELKPKADYCDLILKSKNAINVSQIAKDYGMTCQEFNNLLHELHIQYKTNDQWVLYREHQNKGYTKSKTFPVYKNNVFIRTSMQTKWTQKGRLFLYEELKKVGIMPTMEREN